MAAELEAMQNSVKSSLRAANQQNTVQSAKVDAMGYRLEEMKDLLLHRELRMEVQMAELNNQMHTLSTATRAVHDGEQAKANEPTASSSKMVPMRTLNPPITLKTSPKTEPKALKPPPAGKKTTKVHVCASNQKTRFHVTESAKRLERNNGLEELALWLWSGTNHHNASPFCPPEDSRSRGGEPSSRDTF